ncbi:MAG: YitT family protein [Clostridia bacterium]|nr:YitT family protein [Clostridia bacterium]
MHKDKKLTESELDPQKGEEKEELSETKSHKKINLDWLNGIEEKPKKIKGTPDVNLEPTTKSGKFFKGLWSYVLITIGTALVACGVYFFKFPNHFTIGGVSSFAVLFSEAIGHAVSESMIMSIANMLLLAIALIIFGKNFAVKTVYSTLLLNGIVLVLERVLPITEPLTESPFLEMLLTIGGIAVGSAILFSQGASSGGTDIIAMILKRFTNLNTGMALFISDALIVIASPFVFNSFETKHMTTIFLCSALGLILKSFIVDNVIDGINMNKCFIIVTTKEKEVCDFINNELHRGATISDCRGSFSHVEKKMIVAVLNRQQATMLKLFLKQTDPTAFTVITNSSDILGKGFRIV